MSIFSSSSLRSFEDFKERIGAQFRQTLKNSSSKDVSAPPSPPAYESRRPSVVSKSKSAERVCVTDPAFVLLDVMLAELAKRQSARTLEDIGLRAGRCIVDLLPIGLQLAPNNQELAKFIQRTFWKAVFGKQAEHLKRAKRSDQTYDSFCIDDSEFRWGSKLVRAAGAVKGDVGLCSRYCCGLIRGALQAVSFDPAHSEENAIAVQCEISIKGYTRFWISLQITESTIPCLNEGYGGMSIEKQMAADIGRLFRVELIRQSSIADKSDTGNNSSNVTESSPHRDKNLNDTAKNCSDAKLDSTRNLNGGLF